MALFLSLVLIVFEGANLVLENYTSFATEKVATVIFNHSQKLLKRVRAILPATRVALTSEHRIVETDGPGASGNRSFPRGQEWVFGGFLLNALALARCSGRNNREDRASARLSIVDLNV